MDAVRGTAIILLLLYHCTAIPQTLGMPMPTALRWFSTFFMPYRMPTLMVLSGLLLARSLRKPLPDYFAGKVAGIVWPYLVWVVVAKFVWLDAVGEPWWEWRAWYATSYLWFLFFLGCYYLIAPALRALPVWLPVVAAWVLAVLLVQGSVEQRLAYFAVFFFAGHALAGGPRLVERLTPRYRLRLYGLLTVDVRAGLGDLDDAAAVQPVVRAAEHGGNSAGDRRVPAGHGRRIGAASGAFRRPDVVGVLRRALSR